VYNWNRYAYTNMVMRMIGRVRFITGEEMCIIGIVR